MKYIIIVPVNQIDRRELENIQDQNFKSVQELESTIKLTEPNYELLDLSTFMDAWNNEEITELNNWLGYVNIEHK